MGKFKEGDKLQFHGNGWCGIKRGQIVTFDSYHPTDSQFVRIKEALATNPGSNYYANAFDVVRPKKLAMVLSEDPTERKGTPITTGVLDYFPRALAAVAQCSKAGNDQHNPGQPLHWAKGKSTDHADCIARHLIDRNSVDTDGISHAAKLAWRALAYLETKLEQEASK